MPYVPFSRFRPRRRFTRRPRRNTRRPFTRRNWSRTKQMVGQRAASGMVPYVSPHPKSMLAKMRFSLNSGLGHSITSSSGAVVDWTYRANDCYDPYAGAGGNQPRNFDQLMALYRHGVVVKSTIVLDFFINENTSSSATMYTVKCGVLLNDSATALGAASHADIAEHPRARSIILAPGSGGPKRVIWSYTPKSFFSIKDAQDEEDLYFSSGASPSEQAVYHVFGWAVDSQTQEAFVTGYIDYTVLMIHPLEPSQS